MHSVLALFRRDRSANTVVMFALAMIPVVGAVGAAVDYSFASKIRAELQAAADSAVIGAIAKSAPAMAAAATMTEDGPISSGVADAVKLFNAQLGGKTRFTLTNVTATVEKKSGSVNASVSFTAQVPVAILGIFSKSTLTVNGISKASNTLPTYIDFYLLLDNTPSMGVGATTNDINTMVANTPDKCAFACHDMSTTPNDYYGLAKKLGVQMRIDTMRQATQKLMDTASATQVVSSQFRMAIYTFGSAATSPGLTAIQSLTSNLAGAKAAASKIDLMTVPYQNYRGDTLTDFHDVLAAMNKAIPNPGSGTAASPQRYLFFVSDGVADRALGLPICSKKTTTSTDPKTGMPYLRCQEPLDVALCTAIKNRGVKIAVLYTTYLPLPTNAWYNNWIAPFQGQIATNMQTCASPGLYFEVSPSQGIAEAMEALFRKAVAQARLTF
jgi:Flp pilus assembly protein TadG